MAKQNFSATWRMAEALIVRGIPFRMETLGISGKLHRWIL